ncbi:unnamed protein product [Didymodactylos carnosus]|uniref:Uncharacterized protein n=1 Tax=Didymodactylos carnosus TaxID=1234261 RepID=A0A814WYS1_9BILA|nr:unnamed protein product [Didymodactylos carnosus]CAF1208593.1 unnamed protein product [Didymodactylos carnosus]CAF3972718.1 unnamed protein product [Didymodactylos carnosus]CAF3978132.1 unnamed protein product [Didymodactylos carnosus]
MSDWSDNQCLPVQLASNSAFQSSYVWTKDKTQVQLVSNPAFQSSYLWTNDNTQVQLASNPAYQSSYLWTNDDTQAINQGFDLNLTRSSTLVSPRSIFSVSDNTPLTQDGWSDIHIQRTEPLNRLIKLSVFFKPQSRRPLQRQPQRPLQRQPQRPLQRRPQRPLHQRPLQQRPQRPLQQRPQRPLQHQPQRRPQQQQQRMVHLQHWYYGHLIITQMIILVFIMVSLLILQRMCRLATPDTAQ